MFISENVNYLKMDSDNQICKKVNENYSEELKRFDEELRRIRKEDAKRWYEQSTFKSYL